MPIHDCQDKILGLLHQKLIVLLVLFACEQAVQLAPDNAGYRDSRGLARALTGNTQGAIEDFQAFVNSPEFDEQFRNKRKQWIELLKKGKNPFTDEVLEDLKN